MIAAVAIAISALYLVMKSTTVDSTFRISVVDESTWRITGCSFSPSSMAISLTRFFALSSPAWTVVFWTLYSLVTEVASLNALAASSCSQRTISRLPASADMT